MGAEKYADSTPAPAITISNNYHAHNLCEMWFYFLDCRHQSAGNLATPSRTVGKCEWNFCFFIFDLTQFIHLWIIFNSGAVFVLAEKSMHEKTEFCGWKERMGETGKCRTSWKIFIALELKFNPPTNPLSLVSPEFFFFFRGLAHLIRSIYLIRAHNWGCGIEGNFVGAAQRARNIIKSDKARQWVEIWREMWNCKEGRNAKEFAHCFHSPVLVCRLCRIRCVCLT